MKECYPEAPQNKIDAHPTSQQAAFPPPNPVFPGTSTLRTKGWRLVGVLTIGGEVELSRRYFWSPAWGGTDSADAPARGRHIGSGLTEAMGKNQTLRLKRSGTKWDADHAATIMNRSTRKAQRRGADDWPNRKCT